VAPVGFNNLGLALTGTKEGAGNPQRVAWQASAEIIEDMAILLPQCCHCRLDPSQFFYKESVQYHA